MRGLTRWVGVRTECMNAMVNNRNDMTLALHPNSSYPLEGGV